ncbi:MAG: GGDEF domain-containing protein [Planctomycetota bacterium]|nr:MAG: GGDEF domain-containing protein [Planctomycetota bacterium]
MVPPGASCDTDRHRGAAYMVVSPDLLTLLAGTGVGAFMLGYAMHLLVRPAAVAAPPTEQLEGPRAARQNGPDFDAWKGRKLVHELQETNTELTNLLTLLPGLTRRITETMSRREIAPLLADMTIRLCIPPPERVLVFYMARNGEELVLSGQQGYAEETLPLGLRVPVHVGRLGFCLRRGLPMDERDFRRESHVRGYEDTPLPFGIDVAAPIVHNREPLGIIVAEGLPSESRIYKRMLAVSANLGAIAIANADFVSQIRRLADTDPLTGLYNKRYLFQELEAQVARAEQSGRPLSVFMFDIDHFKHFNDRNGHQAGDQALRITAEIVLQRIRDGDTAARYGGEEFVVILPDTPKEGAYAFAEAVREAIEACSYPHGENQPLGRVTISGGVATWGEDGRTGAELIEAADARLYRGKKAGRNRVSH